MGEQLLLCLVGEEPQRQLPQGNEVVSAEKVGQRLLDPVHRVDVGRTPEFLGKKIRGPQLKLVVVYILTIPLVVLVLGSASVVVREMPVFYRRQDGRRSIAATMIAAKITARMNPVSSE